MESGELAVGVEARLAPPFQAALAGQTTPAGLEAPVLISVRVMGAL